MSPLIQLPMSAIKSTARIIANILRVIAWCLDPSTRPPWRKTTIITRLPSRRHNDPWTP